MGRVNRMFTFKALARPVSVWIFSSLLAGCMSSKAPLETEPVVNPIGYTNEELRLVPPAKRRTVVAVYEYNDLTGQYKDSPTVQSLSRAVTQGGAPILVKALKDAGQGSWFSVLERDQLDNLLQERQILTEMRRLYRQEAEVNPAALPPLLHASIIIEGAIIGYDSNTVTGGAGARFLGIGGDTKYERDTVTVALRAVSVKTGEVLTNVTARKGVASYALQGGAFRYLKLDEILEAEAGITYNEPRQIAVESTVEAAVQALIVSGADLGIWHFSDPGEGRKYIAAYHEEVYGEEHAIALAARPRPVTRDPSRIAMTIPKPRQSVTVTQIRPPNTALPQPQKAQPTTPPPGQSEAAPSRPNVPPAPVGEEVIGQAPDTQNDLLTEPDFKTVETPEPNPKNTASENLEKPDANSRDEKHHTENGLQLTDRRTVSSKQPQPAKVPADTKLPVGPSGLDETEGGIVAALVGADPIAGIPFAMVLPSGAAPSPDPSPVIAGTTFGGRIDFQPLSGMPERVFAQNFE